ncbi:MAG: DUF211 domain-containing protein [Methanomethylovorans sp.]|uniref:DUF211 domain-containing protein n=1 Tax=Methanomethylovorans sp. TaxID=2758717 RepID=UPI000A400DAB|nr:DUF211 domain-containing protein [Methanomethylovorans sp.]
MPGIIRMVLDVLKPHHPSIVEFSKQLSVLPGVSGVNLSLYEVDQQTETIKITIEGDDLDYEEIKKSIDNLGAVVHSIDEIVAGHKLVEEVETLQER